MYNNSGYISKTVFDFEIYDNIKHKYGKAEIELLTPILELPNSVPSTPAGAQLQWRFSMRNAPFVDNVFSLYDYTAYPEFITLTKQ